MPTFCPYGTLENTRGGVSTHILSLRDFGKHRGGVSYPHFVPTGLWKISGAFFLPTFRPYGTLENTRGWCFYPHFVPTGLWKTSGLVFPTHILSLRDFGKHRGGVSTHILSLRDFGKHRGLVFPTHILSLRDFVKHRGWCFYPHLVPTGLLKTSGRFFSTHITPLTGLPMYGK